MKTLKVYLAGLLTLIVLTSCNYSQNSKSENKKECDFVPSETIAEWGAEFQKPAYDVYRNFDNIPFPKTLIKDTLPHNKHIFFYFGMIEGTQQWYYLFTLIGTDNGEKAEIDYSTLMYYSKGDKKWLLAEKELFETARIGWKSYVTESAPLPTLGYEATDEDINVCPHKKVDRIRFGIDKSSSDKDYWLKLYFHEESILENPDPVNFDALLPCPPSCLL